LGTALQFAEAGNLFRLLYDERDTKTFCMKKRSLALLLVFPLFISAQNDSLSNLMNSLEAKAPGKTKQPTKVFLGQRLINANTVEVLEKGKLEFKVIHNFFEFGGSNGGVHHFFGLDNAADVKISFQVGLTDRLNIITARTRGDQYQSVTELWELGLKYRFLRQLDNDPSHPLSLTVFANTVVSSMKANPTPGRESSYTDFWSRMSNVVQVMAARKFGRVSLQLNPTYVHTNRVVPGDDRNLFAIGGGVRLPVTRSIVLIADYFHAFRSQESKDSLRAIANRNPGKEVQYGVGYDAFGIGFEITTPGHIFHLNFTNASNILENRFIPRTLATWRLGQFRWGFTMARNFVLFRPKKKK
jgi:hypothetical protein